MSNTISNAYLEMQRKLHERPSYGVASLAYAPVVGDIIIQAGVKSISDYGAGKKNLLHGLNKAGISGFEYFPYDPVFIEYGLPRAADLVCCIDVLEHIEPNLIDNVILDLALITVKLGFFTINTGPAVKVLADGRNAHLIQKPQSWWLVKLSEYFDVIHLQSDHVANNGFWILVKPIVK
jgi:hypothetical protein